MRTYLVTTTIDFDFSQVIFGPYVFAKATSTTYTADSTAELKDLLPLNNVTLYGPFFYPLKMLLVPKMNQVIVINNQYVYHSLSMTRL